MQRIIFCLLAMALILSDPLFAQDLQPLPTPDAQAILTRAEQVTTLTEVTAQQNATTINLMEKLVWFFGIVIAVAAVFLGLYGFNTQRGFQETMKDYRSQLEEIRTAYRQGLSEFQAEQKKMQALAADTATKVAEIEAIRQELSGIRISVTEEFTAAKQALVLLAMGNRLFNDGKRREAIDIYQEAQRLQPDAAEINYRLGRALSNAGRYDEAIAALERALNAKPDHAEGHMELGLTYRRHAEQANKAEERLAEYRLAERSLRRAVELRPGYADALGALGGLFRREGRYEEALQCYQRATQGEPNLSYALNNLASLAWFLDKQELARTTYERVEKAASERIVANVPETFWDYYDRALARLVLGKQEEALADQIKAIALTPDVENYRSVLDVLQFLKRAPTLIKGLDEFIAMVDTKLVAG